MKWILQVLSVMVYQDGLLHAQTLCEEYLQETSFVARWNFLGQPCSFKVALQVKIFLHFGGVG